MSRRLPAPSPHPRDAPANSTPEDEAVDPDADWDLDDDLDDFDPSLLDPAAWPDDDEDEDSAKWLEEEEHVDAVADLTAPDDEEDTEEILEPLEGTALEDPLDPSHDELPIIGMRLVVEVDGAEIAAVAAPNRAQTHLAEVGGEPGRRSVLLRIGGVSQFLEVTVERSDGARILLGRDALCGRFLLRP